MEERKIKILPYRLYFDDLKSKILQIYVKIINIQIYEIEILKRKFFRKKTIIV